MTGRDEALGQGPRADLLPCPFCGGKANLYENQVDFVRKWSVGCGDCNANMDVCEDTEAEAAECWNTRPSLPAPGREEILVLVEQHLAFQHKWLSDIFDGLGRFRGEGSHGADVWQQIEATYALWKQVKTAFSRPPENGEGRSAGRSFKQCDGCDGHECDKQCAYPGATNSDGRADEAMAREASSDVAGRLPDTDHRVDSQAGMGSERPSPSGTCRCPVECDSVWHEGDHSPPVEAGHEREFIVAVQRAHNGKVYSFSASYLNAYPLSYEYSCTKGHEDPEKCKECTDDGCPTTGWFRLTGDNGDGGQYESLNLRDGDKMMGWREVPRWEDRSCRIPAVSGSDTEGGR